MDMHTYWLVQLQVTVAPPVFIILAAGASPNFIAKQMGHTDAQRVYWI